MIHPLRERPISSGPAPRRALRSARPGSVIGADRSPAVPAGRSDIPTEVLVALRRVAEPDSGCAEAMAMHLHHRLPDLDRRSVAGSAFAETRACCQAHLEVVARLVSEGGAAAAVAIPGPAIAHARSLIRRGVSLDVLLRTYHLGQAFLSAQAGALFQEAGLDDARRLRATVAVDTLLFEYVDHVSGAMAVVYGNERDNWHRSPEAVRMEALKVIMDQGGVDQRLLERRLGYELTGHHMAFILSTDGQGCGFEGLRDEAGRIAAALGATASLVVPGEGASAWAWCRTVEDVADSAARLHAQWRPADRVSIAFANPAPGVDGFRTSHLEALETLEFVGRFPHAITEQRTASYRSVELVSLLTEDSERAARFVSSRLGLLSDPDPRLRDLRETSLAFLRHNRSHARAGEALFLHKNTVYTRVKRAEKLLGVRSDAWGIELETALVLASILETAPCD